MHNSRIRLTLHPDHDGAKGLRAEYGERLVCVRYRYDTQQQKRYKTVELVVAEERWTPPIRPTVLEQIVAIQVAAPETTIRQRVKQAGGQWEPQRGVWTLRYDRVVALGLSKRIVKVTGC
jgi:hypothetical protein